MEENLLDKLKDFYESKKDITNLNLTVSEEELLKKMCNNSQITDIERKIWKYVVLIIETEESI